MGIDLLQSDEKKKREGGQDGKGKEEGLRKNGKFKGEKGP